MSDEIRAAATIVLWRQDPHGFKVLMGQRGHGAAFMPSKYVFPGGAVDPEDHTDSLPGLAEDCARRLSLNCPSSNPTAGTLANAALRELAEETGLSHAELAPGALRFIFRAITPPGRSRRFDARFFLCSAQNICGDSLDFANASGELSHLHWIGLTEARALDLPFITEVVLAEVSAILRGQNQPGVPFFDNSDQTPIFRRL